MATSTGAPPEGSASPTGTEAAGWPVMLHRNVKRIMAPVTGRLLSPLDSTFFLHSTGTVGISFQVLRSRALQESWALIEFRRLRQQLCPCWCHACWPSLAVERNFALCFSFTACLHSTAGSRKGVCLEASQDAIRTWKATTELRDDLCVTLPSKCSTAHTRRSQLR